ncbi:hypothetical protein EK904_007252 [Melospiza melodia maxima]|nr:hypothetical protein EK904_007252 [Melospiza melodia maxima]
MSFPVDILNNCSHEELENSAEDYLFALRWRNPNAPEFFSLPDHRQVPITLTSVSFVPLYGQEKANKVLALFAPWDSFTAVALYLADQWWSIDDIVKTSVPARQGLHQKQVGAGGLQWQHVKFGTVKSVGERVVLYVLNRIIYRTQEMEGYELPFLCHGSSHYAKIMWKKGEAIGFYSVKPTACRQYLEKYPEDTNLLWQVEGGGDWFQKKSIMSIMQKEGLKIADPNATHAPFWIRSSPLKRQRLNRSRQQPGLETSQRDEGNALRMSKSRPPLLSPISESPEDLVEVPKVDTVEKDKEIIVENEDQSVLEVEMHVSPSEKQSEMEEMPSEPLNGEVAEETGKTSLMAEGEMVNEVPSGESKLLSENQGKEPVMPLVPLTLDAPAKPPEDTESEKVLNENDSEMLAEEVTSVEKDGTEEQQESEKASTENAAAVASKEEPSDNGPPNSVVTEAAEETVSENLPSSLEDQNEEAGHNSQEAPAALNQSSLVMVELVGVSFQQPSGQEAQKNQLEEPSEESAEQPDHDTQTVAERAADSSSEEAEIEVPVVDRRNLRRKPKGYKGPPKKKGKPA